MDWNAQQSTAGGLPNPVTAPGANPVAPTTTTPTATPAPVSTTGPLTQVATNPTVTAPSPTATPTSTSTAQGPTPTWYDDLSQQFGNTISGLMNRAVDQTNNWYDQPLVAAITPEMQAATGALTQATQMAQGVGAAGQPMFDRAGNLIDQGVSQVGAASTYDPEQVKLRMNPYLTDVDNAITSNVNRNLTESIIPGINSTFTGAGQFGSTRNSDFMSRGVRDTQAELAKQLAASHYGAEKDAMADYLGWGRLGVDAGNSMITGSNTFGNIGSSQASAAAQAAQAAVQAAQAQANQAAKYQDIEQSKYDKSYQDWMNQYQTPINAIKDLGGVIGNTTKLYERPASAAQSTTSGLDSLAAIIAAGVAEGKK